MSTPYKFFVGVLSTVLSLMSMVVGIMLTNSVTLTFWKMISYDAIFLFAFLTFVWCAILFTRNPGTSD